MNDRDLNEHIEELRESYHAPPEPPADLMWARIQRARGTERSRRWQWAGWAVAAAAVLALGIGIGRVSAPGPQVITQVDPGSEIEALLSPATSAPVGELQSLRTGAFRVAARHYLQRTEVLLTEFRASENGTANLAIWANRMLGQTRLFMDSPLNEDYEMQMLLLDLEFVFAQIAQIAGSDASQERDWVSRNLEEKDLMLRLRSTLPADNVRASAQGGRS